MSRCTGAQRRDERLIRRESERRSENCHLRTAGDVLICFSSGKAGGSSSNLPPELPSNLISACVYRTPDWFRRAAARGLGDAVSSNVDDPAGPWRRCDATSGMPVNFSPNASHCSDCTLSAFITRRPSFGQSWRWEDVLSHAA